MKLKLITLAGILMFGIGSMKGQSIDNALLFSADELVGTGRYVGMGGAFGAFGVNQSALSSNPGGIGLYRRSDFGLSLSVNDMSSTSAYEGNNVSNGNAIFAMDNLGLVFSNQGDEDFVRVNFGVVYNRLANFNESYTISGQTEDTSLLNVFVNQANGTHFEDVGSEYFASAGLAYNTYLINPLDDSDTEYSSEIPYGQVTQTKTIERTGRKGETLIAGGANVDNKVYFGVSLGFPTFQMKEETSHNESDLDPTLELDNFTFNESVTLNGNGFNVKAGIIVQATEWLRLGGAYHSPSWYTVNGVFDREMNSRFRDGEEYEASSGGVNYTYGLKTPAKYNINTGIIIGKRALIGADYEYINFSSIKFRDADDLLADVDYSEENNAMKDAYKGAHNFKVGGELRFAKDFAARAGFNYRQNPYEDEITESNGEVFTYTGGLGYRKHGFYIDLAYALSEGSRDHYLYDPEVINNALLDRTEHQMIMTIGIRY